MHLSVSVIDLIFPECSVFVCVNVRVCVCVCVCVCKQNSKLSYTAGAGYPFTLASTISFFRSLHYDTF